MPKRKVVINKELKIKVNNTFKMRIGTRSGGQNALALSTLKLIEMLEDVSVRGRDKAKVRKVLDQRGVKN